MRHYTADLWSPAGARGSVAAYGHYGRPVLVFPTEGGYAGEFADHGMVAAVGDLIDAGRVKLYCVDSFDAGTWSAVYLPLEERALRHAAYESWILDAVVPHIQHDSGGATEVVAAGCSLGAFHALNFAFKRADVFPLALCFSGNYDRSENLSDSRSCFTGPRPDSRWGLTGPPRAFNVSHGTTRRR